MAPTGGSESAVPPPDAADTGANNLADQLASFQTASGYTDIPASVAISGEPFQVYSVALPSQTTFIADGAIVNVGNYMHDAGGTPAMDGSGSSVVNIGATANVTQTQQAAEIPAAPSTGPEPGESLAEAAATNEGAAQQPGADQSLDVTGLLEGFATGSPYLEITISYN
ncbi:MAG: DUF4402 domain-containing protein [Rhodospirillales bacterium]